MPQTNQAASKVLLEVAEFEATPGSMLGMSSGPSPSEATSSSREPRLILLRKLSVTANHATPLTVPWDVVPRPTQSAPCPEKELWDLTVTATLGAAPDNAIRLEIVAEPAPPLGRSKESWHIPEHRRARTTVGIGDQQTTVIARPEKPGTFLAITPYSIRSDADMEHLFKCQMRARGPRTERPRGAAKVQEPKGRRWKN